MFLCLLHGIILLEGSGIEGECRSVVNVLDFGVL